MWKNEDNTETPPGRDGPGGVVFMGKIQEKGTTLTAVPAYTFDGATPESAALHIQL